MYTPPDSEWMTFPRCHSGARAWNLDCDAEEEGEGLTYRTEHWPEREQLVAVVATAATPGTPARIVTLLQNELLPLEVGVFEGHPSGER